MRFEQVYDRWTEHRIASRSGRFAERVGTAFRRLCRRYEGDGLDWLIDLRLGQVSARRHPSMKCCAW
jgi:hypothetical protein